MARLGAAIDILAGQADICIVGGSSFAFLATLFANCAVVVPSGVSFVDQMKPVRDFANPGQVDANQVGYLDWRSIIVPSRTRAAGASYFGGVSRLQDGQGLTEEEKSVARGKLVEVLIQHRQISEELLFH